MRENSLLHSCHKYKIKFQTFSIMNSHQCYIIFLIIISS